MGALVVAEYPFEHVSLVRELGIWDPGAERGRKARDEEIVPWCQRHNFIVVTCDDDFRSSEMRQELLEKSQVEVIWFRKQPSGPQQQLEQIVKHYPNWKEQLGREARAYRQWMQPPRGQLKKMMR